VKEETILAGPSCSRPSWPSSAPGPSATRPSPVVACAVSVGAACGRLAFDSLVQRDAPRPPGADVRPLRDALPAGLGGWRGEFPAAIPHLPGRLGFLLLAVGLAFFGLSYFAAVRASPPDWGATPASPEAVLGLE